MEISFYLHPKVSGKGTQSVNIDIAYGKEPCAPSGIARLQTSTGVTVQTQKPNEWDHNKGWLKSNAEGFANKKHILRELEEKAEQIITEFNKAGKLLDKNTFKESLKPKPVKEVSNPVVTVKAHDAVYYFEQWANQNRNDVSKKHIADMRTQMRYFQEFAPGILPGQITEALVKDFREYLINENDILDISLNKSTHMLKHVLEAAGLNSNYKWLKRKKSGNSQGIVFDLAEQEQVRRWDPFTEKNIKDKHPTQQRQTMSLAKDIFLFLINTGPRYIDLKNLEPYEVKTFTLPDGKEIKVLEYYQIKGGQKRGKPCRVALNAEAISILKKYEGKQAKLLPVPASQNLNHALKEVCKFANIKTPIKRIRYQKGIRKEEVFEKWELAGCHRLRATFATNLFEGGADPKTIQDALGHEDPKTTHIYLHNKDVKQYSDLIRAFETLAS